MNDELKQLIEDAAKLLFNSGEGEWIEDYSRSFEMFVIGNSSFEPCDPERGDLMKVAMAAELIINYKLSEVQVIDYNEWGIKHEEAFDKDDHQSLALAVLRAASAVWKARGE